MRILADESQDGPIVVWLRSIGHDVEWATESLSGAPDDKIVEMACAHDQVILTSDRDFGELVFRDRATRPGVLLVRIRAGSARSLLRTFEAQWPECEKAVLGNFVVLSHGRTHHSR